VATGNFDWDSVYVHKITEVKKTSGNEAFNQLLLGVIDQLGVLPADLAPKPADSLFGKNAGASWLKDYQFINADIKNKLQEVYDHRNQQVNRYVKLSDMRADYSGEKSYENMDFPDEQHRLLFLARVYNAINYFAPYKYLISQKWENVLKRFIPEMIAANDTIAYFKTMLKLAVSLDDGHAQFSALKRPTRVYDAVFGKYCAPFYTSIVDGTVIVTKIADEALCKAADIQTGDIISSIDGEPVVARIKRLRIYISGSNEASKDHYLNWMLSDTKKTDQKITLKRKSQVRNTVVKCMLLEKRNWGDLTNFSVSEKGAYKTVGKDIAYVYAMQIADKNVDSIKALVKKSKAVIFDVRNYPNNDAFYNIFDMFLAQPTPINYSLLISPENPGYFKWEISPKLGGINTAPYAGKVIVLADTRSQSQGEYSVITFQTIKGAVTIGQQTAGADGVVTYIPVGGDLAISYSGYGIYYADPAKSQTQRKGVRIDIPVKPTIEDVQQNRDVAFERALKYLKDQGID